MQRTRGERIKLSKTNWELPALTSLVLSVVASLYAVTPEFNAEIAAFGYSLSLAAGLVSIVMQIAASRARIFYFTKEDWMSYGDELVLEIESSFLLFRVETLKTNGFYEEVVGSTETSKDGRVTRVLFKADIPDKYFYGRIVIR
jgi:hypothetical protein